MPRDPRLDRLAILTLEHAANLAKGGPVERTWGMKLALAYIATNCPEAREDCNAFWAQLAEKHEASYSVYLANMGRHGSCSRLLNGFYRSLGLPLGSLWYQGVTGKKEEVRWWPGKAFGDHHDATDVKREP